MKNKFIGLFQKLRRVGSSFREKNYTYSRAILRFNRLNIAAVVLTVGLVALMVNGLAVCAIYYASFSEDKGPAVSSKQDLDSAVRELRMVSLQVRGYEEQLRNKAVRLNAVLSGVAELDYKYPVAPISKPLNKGVAKSKKAIGGGDEEREIFRSPSEHKALQRYKSPDAKDLLAMLDYQFKSLRSLPIGYPVNGAVSSGYGWRRSPYSKRSQKHHGIDLAVRRNTPITASAEGKIIKAGYKGSYGKIVIINHGDGMETRYAHLSSVAVKVGDTVRRGQKIGLSGSTGRSTGPHLHYEVRVDGESKDPLYFMQLVDKIKNL